MPLLRKIIQIILCIVCCGAVIYCLILSLKVQAIEEKISQHENLIEKNFQDQNKKNQIALSALSDEIFDRVQALEKKINALALSLKTGSSDQAEHLVTLILQAQHDLAVLSQAMIADRLLQNDAESISWWVSKLQSLSPQDRINIIHAIDKRLGWDDLSKQVQEMIQPKHLDTSSGIWSLAERFGVRVEKSMDANQADLMMLNQFVENGQYHNACHMNLDTDLPQETLNMLHELCSPENFIIQQWKQIES